MPSLKPWSDLPDAGAIDAADAPRPETGGWRTGLMPEVDFSRCVNCLLCWIYCPDSAVRLDGTTFQGFDLTHCKGCEICAEICPVNAIEMIPEDSE